MNRLDPYMREEGVGPEVVCLHANASTSGQWRALQDLLSSRFHVICPDLYGSGKSPEWTYDRRLTLSDEVEFIEPMLARAKTPLAFVGHSHGAAVALIAAVMNPERVRAMALYEPTLFALVDAETCAPNDADGIRNAVADARLALDAGAQDAAARRFIDYWMEKGSWDAVNEQRKPAIAGSIKNVGRWAHALFNEPTTLNAFRSLDIPILYMTGKRSTAAARAVTRLLCGVLPRVHAVEFEDLGHMGPITHPGVVNETVARFLDQI